MLQHHRGSAISMHKYRMFPGVRPFLVAGLLSAAMLLAGCKPGSDAQAQEGEKKGPDAIPVEVGKVVRRAIAASYANTATLEPRAEAQVAYNKAADDLANASLTAGRRIRTSADCVHFRRSCMGR